MPITVAEIKNNSERLHEPIWLLRKRLDLWRAIEDQNQQLAVYGQGIFADYATLESLGDYSAQHVKFSVSGAKGIPWRKAINDPHFEPILKKHLFDAGEVLRKNYWLGLAGAGFSQAIVVETGMVSVKPVRIQMKQKQSPALVSLMIIVPDNAAVDIIEEVESQGFFGAMVQVHVGRNARVRYFSVDSGPGTTMCAVSRHATVAKGGLIQWNILQLGEGKSQLAITSDLVAVGATAETNLLFCGTNTDQDDLYVETTHKGPLTNSKMISKGILTGRSKAIYRGLIRIEKDAKGSIGNQKADTLILSENAEVDAVPNLEIENNEVKCSHSVSTSRIDKEKIFYFTSRGYTEAQARQEIITAHFTPIIENITNKKLLQKVSSLITEKLK